MIVAVQMHDYPTVRHIVEDYANSEILSESNHGCAYLEFDVWGKSRAWNLKALLWERLKVVCVTVFLNGV